MDKRRPALILTRRSKLHLLTWVTVAPITTTIRGITSEVAVGPRNGLDHDSVISCDNITTVRKSSVGDTIGLLLDDQEPALARAISDAGPVANLVFLHSTTRHGWWRDLE
ncbi:type II toxin-antitoxin system PemK/MazF family toxin [Segeticoccus rhizosphaerae]|uniref:type II toxin-antitoxin system PemK/MazF family toxin n=1 Tax=Segeticoccus rhizosphaerae TaxID=1104777 RepID=UPI002367FBD8|nr:type II toxin-antitoxin system PemK/MazF family toxin [Ornithinicoccus soli]